MGQLDELRALLGQDKVSRGTVLEVVGDVATLATRHGGASLRIAPGLVLANGDTVEVQDGLVIGKLRGAGGLPVYEI
ncbi:MAG: hypothetical protein JKX92_06170 [Porticoccaceae bacterium]|nr:hypothetical protein [Porticoccaceae bacterium]